MNAQALPSIRTSGGEADNIMAWWRSSRKRDPEDEAVAGDGAGELASEVGDAQERAQARGNQPSAVPSPRAEAGVEERPEEISAAHEEPLMVGPAREQISDVERWHLIKQDLEEIDPDFVSELSEIVKSARDEPGPLGTERITDALRRLDVRYLVDENGGVVALWERHVVQVRAEGPDEDILVLRSRAYQTVPHEWAERGYAAVNEWNRTRRFLKAYLGEQTESGSLPVFGEIQVPVRPGITDALLDELIDCGTAIAGTFVDWLEGEIL
jgi:hypothetical protein